MGMSQFLVGSPLVSKPARSLAAAGLPRLCWLQKHYKLCLIPKATPQGTGIIVVAIVVVRESCPRLCFRKTKRKQQQHPNIAVQHRLLSPRLLCLQWGLIWSLTLENVSSTSVCVSWADCSSDSSQWVLVRLIEVPCLGQWSLPCSFSLESSPFSRDNLMNPGL